MPIGPAKMSLFDHLSELRARLVRIVVALLVAICFFYIASPTMGQILLWPVRDFLPTSDSGAVMLNALDPFEAFTTRLTITLFFSVIGTSPVTIWQILAFFLPALKPNERKWFMPTFIAACALFIFGVVFCYCVILNAAFGWLTDQSWGLGTIEPRMSTYISIIIKFLLSFGVAFEIPLVVFYLVIFNIVSYKKIRSSWRYIYVTLLVICAMVTPDSSPITMLLMFGALVVLYEASLLLARIVLKKRIEKEQEELDELDEAEMSITR